MNKETIVTSAFRVHRSKFSCSLAAALLDGLFEHPARHCPVIQDGQVSEVLACVESPRETGGTSETAGTG